MITDEISILYVPLAVGMVSSFVDLDHYWLALQQQMGLQGVRGAFAQSLGSLLAADGRYSEEELKVVCVEPGLQFCERIVEQV